MVGKFDVTAVDLRFLLQSVDRGKTFLLAPTLSEYIYSTACSLEGESRMEPSRLFYRAQRPQTA